MTAPLKALIVDDEPLAVERLQIICASLPDLVLVGTAGDGEAALRLVEGLKPDLVLLDIAMPMLDGMGAARRIAEIAPDTAVIFVTAFESHAVEAFDLAALDYVLKPVAPDRLAKAIERVRRQRESYRPAPAPAGGGGADGWGRRLFVSEFWVPHRSELMRIDAESIDRIEAERDYMRLHVGDRCYLLHHTIKSLEERLDPERFVRLHRSHIVRRDHIVGLSHAGGGIWFAKLADGSSIRIGRTYLAEVKKVAGRH